MAKNVIIPTLLAPLLLLVVPSITYAEGKCNGALLKLELGYPNTEITINSVDYSSGYLSTQCNDQAGGSPSVWSGSGVINDGQYLNLYAHEDGGNASGTINMTVTGENGSQNISLDFDYRNTGISCDIEQAKVTTSNNNYTYGCGYQNAKASCDGNTESASMSFNVENVNNGC